MTTIDNERLLRVAKDATFGSEQRCSAIALLVEQGTRDTAEALLEIGARQGEDETVLRAAGAGLARLQVSGVEVSEWDLRNLTLPTAEAFLE